MLTRSDTLRLTVKTKDLVAGEELLTATEEKGRVGDFYGYGVIV